MGPHLLGLVLQGLGRLALRSRHREAGDRRPLAPPRLQAVLALEVKSARSRASQSWRTFLENHVKDIARVDFFTVPTATFRVLYCFVVLRHERRRVVHFNVTANPTATWTAQQVIEAFPYDEAPRYLRSVTATRSTACASSIG